jgi:hypothetical protein
VKADYLKEEILTKYVSHETDPPGDRRQRAINKWLATERENEATNDRLLLTPEEYNILPRVTYGSFVGWCQDTIRDIIGDTVPLEALIGSFSGGASTSRKRTSSQPASKYLGKAHVTQRCLEIFNQLADEMPGWLREGDHPLEIEVVPGNVMFTVPKKTDIDRCACKEPDLNMFIQKGIGSHFRDCLRRVGINLNDQSINRSLAREGSLTGRLATLDLSSASDSVSEGLVALFLPETWHTHLDAVRCQVTVIDGEEHRNSMFSSMGNGFTFELESLLFYVLARATAYFTGTKGVVSVYGDDIICPTDMVHDLMWILGYFGFSVNTDKSFTEGPFRESCGGHYHDGYDITPFYIRKPIDSMPDLIDVANKLRHWGECPVTSVIDPLVEEIWLWLKSMVPNVLWGGEDFTFKYQLVSHDHPVLRLVEVMKRRDAGEGSYPHWLNATWDRTKVIEGIVTSAISLNSNRLRLRPVRNTAVPRLPSYFLSEISSGAGFHPVTPPRGRAFTR